MGCEAGWSKTSSPSSLEEKYLITVIFDMVIRKRGYIKVHRKKTGMPYSSLVCNFTSGV